MQNEQQNQAFIKLFNKAFHILKSIRNTRDLNRQNTGSNSVKISENILTQIDEIMLELDQIKQQK